MSSPTFPTLVITPVVAEIEEFLAQLPNWEWQRKAKLEKLRRKLNTQCQCQSFKSVTAALRAAIKSDRRAFCDYPKLREMARRRREADKVRSSNLRRLGLTGKPLAFVMDWLAPYCANANSTWYICDEIRGVVTTVRNAAAGTEVRLDHTWSDNAQVFLGVLLQEQAREQTFA